MQPRRCFVLLTVVALTACLFGPPGCNLIAPPVESPNARWVDDFQSYSVGQFPIANWARSGNASAPGNQVTDIFAATGPLPHDNEVLQLTGVYEGHWAGGALRAVDLSSSHMIQFTVRNSEWGGVEYDHPNASVDLKTGPDWTTSGRLLMYFGLDGKIRTSNGTLLTEGTILGEYVYGEWYDVEIWYKRSADSTVVLSYTINGAYAGAVSYPFIPEEWDLAYIGLWSGDTTVWFDDVEVRPR